MDVFNVTADAEQFTCNAYLVTGERTVLVDAGSMPGVVDVVADHVDTLDAVVVTHQHSDHVDQLDAVCERFGPEVYAYAEHPQRTDALDDGDTVEMGDETFEVVYTPGHAADHISLVGETALFSGDVVVHNDGAFDNGSFGRTDLPGQSRERLIQSISQLLDRLPDSVTTMYAGHGDVFAADPDGDSVRDVVRRALLRAEERQPKYPDG
ncbi:Glyoxylase, beta-lactamase superfamily II [Halogranum gelatinilyticum]|uniref:Glyoxylase, beta-lactamase superfamily II n=1 Tax=Halogranum gelatinilyticum TaxID=660521 RepID=A0A1G9Q2P8_9EURY|nr:MBL fold metallo-hydrolase [Halogranum gelatinilyticum]SDM04615.1 Glyoxylase, beta-lactamase superfamily II [Halogranum gelatinilyticum]